MFVVSLLAVQKVLECYEANSRSRPGTVCKRESARLNTTIEFRALTDSISKIYVNYTTSNPEHPISNSTFRKIIPRNIGKPNRPSDICKKCFRLPKLEEEFMRFWNRAFPALACTVPESILQARCFEKKDRDRIKKILIESHRILRHKQNAHRQRGNIDIRIELLSKGVDEETILFLLDFKQNMGFETSIFLANLFKFFFTYTIKCCFTFLLGLSPLKTPEFLETKRVDLSLESLSFYPKNGLSILLDSESHRKFNFDLRSGVVNKGCQICTNCDLF